MTPKLLKVNRSCYSPKSLPQSARLQISLRRYVTLVQYFPDTADVSLTATLATSFAYR